MEAQTPPQPNRAQTWAVSPALDILAATVASQTLSHFAASRADTVLIHSLYINTKQNKGKGDKIEREEERIFYQWQ